MSSNEGKLMGYPYRARQFYKTSHKFRSTLQVGDEGKVLDVQRD